jgi:hypothetical protein
MDCLRWIGWGNVAAIAVTLTVGCSDDGAGNPQDEGTGTQTASGPTAGSASEGGGGSSLGGSVTGGGGSATADGGETAGDSTGGPGPDLTCTVDRDCQLVNDCCACGAVNVEEEVMCNEPPCFAPACGSAEPTPVCEGGECTIEWACNEMLVACDALPPDCPEGRLPSIAGDCYTGDCVDAGLCDVVPDCSYCGDGEACVTHQSFLGPALSCVPLPAECNGVATCACLPDACAADSEVCVDGDGGVSCSCPAC